LLWAYDGTIDEFATWRHGSFDEQAAWFVQSGRAQFKDADGVPITASAGQWMFPRIGAPALQRFAAGSRIYSIRFWCGWSDRQPLFGSRSTRVVDGASVPELQRAAERLVGVTRGKFLPMRPAVMSQVMDAREFHEIDSTWTSWLFAWSTACTRCGLTPNLPERGDTRVARVLNSIEQQPLRSRPDRATLAADVGLSASQLDRTFVRQTGLTARAHVDAKRVQSARQRVGESDTPIKVIAYDLGFKRLSHFSAWFRKHVGVSARDLRGKRRHAV